MLPDKDGPGVGGGQRSSEGEDPSVSLFREYLRLKTVHPDPDYGAISSSQYTNQAMPFGNVTVGFFFFGIYLILLGFGVKTSCWNTHYFLCCCLISLMIWHWWCLWDIKCFQLWAYDLIKKAELLSQASPPLICGYKTKTVALTKRMGLHVAAAQIVLSVGRLAPLTLGCCTSEDSCSFSGCFILFVPGTRELRIVPQ